MIGRILAHYEVLEKIGSGGMGDVYLARDSRLGRNVAIKVLPDAFARDAQRLARFEREAQLLATLNHPNIASIHGREQADEIQMLVMELVPGPTLAERLTSGSLSLEDALEIARQIAEALESAHEKGVIHRDLKPANIKVTPEGTVKVLDFGLAKALADGQHEDVSNSPTLSLAATQQGVILGTASYMSPEQARGKAVDKRTDIFSFGCVLYEMIAGRRAFEGEMVSDILASVLKSDPDFHGLPANLHPKVREIVRRCLEKDPKKRWRDIGDVRAEIESVLTDPHGVHVLDTTAAKTNRGLVAMFGLGALLLSALTGAVVWELRAPVPPQVMRFAITLPDSEELQNLGRHMVAISPDGALIAYTGGIRGGDHNTVSRLYLRAIDQLEARPIPGTENGGRNPFFSPDGEWVGFWSFSDQKLKKVSVRGGPPLALCDAANPFGASWGPNDTIVYGQGGDGIWKVAAAGGKPELVAKVEAGQNAHGPHILPDGKSVLFTVSKGLDWNNSQIVVQPLQGGERRELGLQGSDARYLPSGHLVYAKESTLMIVPFNLSSLQVAGTPAPVVENVTRALGSLTGVAHFSFSNNGTLAYVAGNAPDDARPLLWVDRKGTAETVAGANPRPYASPRLSPDSRLIATAIGFSTLQDIWMYDFARQIPTRLSFETLSSLPIWTPDGRQLTYQTGTPANLWRKPVDLSRPAERLTTSANIQEPNSWSPDGKVLIFSEFATKTGWDLLELSLEGDRKPKPWLQTPYSERAAAFSPDGRWLAYVSNESGRNEVYVRPYPGPGGQIKVSTNGGVQPVWRGRELFYRNGQQMISVALVTSPVLTLGRPEQLFEGSFLGTGAANPAYDVTPDGKRFLMIRTGREASVTQFLVVVHWFEELRR